MQSQSWTAQAPEVILRSIQRGAAVNCYPAHELIRIGDGGLHGLVARTVEVQNVQAQRRSGQNDACQASEDEHAQSDLIHGLSIGEAHP